MKKSLILLFLSLFVLIASVSYAGSIGLTASPYIETALVSWGDAEKITRGGIEIEASNVLIDNLNVTVTPEIGRMDIDTSSDSDNWNDYQSIFVGVKYNFDVVK